MAAVEEEEGEGSQQRRTDHGGADAAAGRSAGDPPVLRISQLDAFELDSTLEQLVWERFSQCFQHCRPGLLTPVEPELRALLQLLLWRFTMYSGSATVGQALLSLRYHNTLSPSTRYRSLSRRQKLGLALLTIGPRWLQERSHSLLRPLGLAWGGGGGDGGGGALSQGLRHVMALISGLTQIASLINFLVFLRNGRHPLLAERVVGARTVFSKAEAAGRDVAYQYMNRELLWHGFAEFLIFLLPLVNTRKVKATVRSLLGGAGEGDGTRDRHNDRDGLGAWKECGLCGEWPTMPHTVGCGHVFCYYCIKSLSIADPALACPRCGEEAGPPQPAQLPLEMTDMRGGGGGGGGGGR